MQVCEVLAIAARPAIWSRCQKPVRMFSCRWPSFGAQRTRRRRRRRRRRRHRHRAGAADEAYARRARAAVNTHSLGNKQVGRTRMASRAKRATRGAGPGRVAPRSSAKDCRERCRCATAAGAEVYGRRGTRSQLHVVAAGGLGERRRRSAWSRRVACSTLNWCRAAERSCPARKTTAATGVSEPRLTHTSLASH